MKFRFKVQTFQTDAVDAVVDCFKGQPPSNGLRYSIDPGAVKAGQTARWPRPVETKTISTEIQRTHWSNWFVIEGSLCAVMRKDGPETLTAATGSRCASSTGTAMQRRPSSNSSSSTA